MFYIVNFSNFDVKSIIFYPIMARAFSQNGWKKPCNMAALVAILSFTPEPLVWLKLLEFCVAILGLDLFKQWCYTWLKVFRIIPEFRIFEADFP